MSTDKKVYFLLIPGLLLVVLIFSWVFIKGSARITISESSITQEGVTFRLSKDKFQTAYTPPQTIELRAGRYTLNATAKNTEEFSTKFWVLPGRNKQVEITMYEQELGGIDEFLNVPNFSLFPYETGDYKLVAKLTTNDNDEKEIGEIELYLYHRMSPAEADLYAAETALFTNKAKQWLRDQEVPESIPLTVIHR